MAQAWQQFCLMPANSRMRAKHVALRGAPRHQVPLRNLQLSAAAELATLHAAEQHNTPCSAAPTAAEHAKSNPHITADARMHSHGMSANKSEQPLTAPISYMQSLHIRNFALIEEQHVLFKPGLNVITGESGAGKSVLVEAFGQVLGMPARDSCVRPPATTACVEARFHLSPQHQVSLSGLAAKLGLPSSSCSSSLHDGQLCLRREITTMDSSVRSRCYVNGMATSLRVLREIGASLVDVNGQHAALSIRDSATQLALLDQIGGMSGLAARFAAGLESLRQMEQQLADIALLGDEEERVELQEMISEVRQSGLHEGEEHQLRAQLRQLDSRRASVERAGLMHLAVSGEGGVGGVMQGLRTLEAHVDAILDQEEAHASSSMSEEAVHGGETDSLLDGEAAESIASMQAALEELEQARNLLRAAEAKVAAYARKFRYLQQDYDEAASRLHAVERLLKQYDCSTSQELLTGVAEAEADLDKWYQMEGQEEEVQQHMSVQRQQLQDLAAQLSMQRREAGRRLEPAVESCLAELAMPGCHFKVDLAWQPSQEALSLEMPAELCSLESSAYAVSPTGLDSVQFLLGAGPGEPLRSLAAVASGGESARILLALKAAPAAVTVWDQQANDCQTGRTAGSPPLMILDELDSGVGARLGRAMGKMLCKMTSSAGPSANASQILCVSHLPQVAAYADNHLCVRKASDSSGRVQTIVSVLNSQTERAHEIAAMLGLGLPQAWQVLEAAQAEQQEATFNSLSLESVYGNAEAEMYKT